MSTASARLLVGRKIVGFDLRSWSDANGVHHDPRIVLDNGATVTCMVTETEFGDPYGITPLYHSHKKPRRKP